MLLWWESLTVLQKVFVTLAVPSTLILILQSVMVLIGLAGGSDGDAGHDGGGVDLDGDGIPDDISGGGHIDFDTDMDSADGFVDGLADGDSSGPGDVYGDMGAHDGSQAHGSHVFGKDADAPAHGAGLSLFTVRGITAFFAVGGWMGLTLTGKEVSPLIAIIISFIAGMIALVGIAYIFRGIMLLQDSGGTVEAENAVGKTAQVYLTIPASNLGKGKVTLVVQEKYVEFDACTRSGNPIKTGETVHVVDVLDDNTLVVEQTIFNKDPNLTVKR